MKSKITRTKALPANASPIPTCQNCGQELISPRVAVELTNPTYDTSKGCSDCTSRCNDCGEMEITDDLTEVADGGLVCESCLDDNYTQCSNCRLFHNNDEIVSTVDDDYVCEDCANRYMTLCQDCNRYVDKEDATYIEDHGDICQDCYSDGNYASCEECGNYLDRDDVIYSEQNECDYCRDCYNELDLDTDEVEVNTNFVTGDKPGHTIKSNRHVGTEIETEGIGDDDCTFRLSELPMGVGAVEDGSLKHGIEILTPPASLNKLESVITDTCKYLRKANLRIEDTCGLHIHLDMTHDKDPKKLVSIMQAYYILEPLFFAMVARPRRDNQYCKSLVKNFEDDDFLPSKAQVVDSTYYKDEMPNKSYKYNSARYYWVNLHSVYYRGTIEIRLHTGSINETKIINWIAIHQAVVDYATSDKFSSDNLQHVMAINDFNERDLRTSQLLLLAEEIGLSGELVKYYSMRIRKFN